MVGHGGSSAGSYLAAPTSPFPSDCAVITLFKSVPVHQLSWLALYRLQCSYISHPVLALIDPLFILHIPDVVTWAGHHAHTSCYHITSVKWQPLPYHYLCWWRQDAAGGWAATSSHQIINSSSASCNNWCTVGGDGGCRVGEVRAGTTSPMPDHKGFKLQ